VLLKQLSKRILVMAGLLMVLPFAINADEQVSPVEVPKAKAKATEEYGCVAPVNEMRKNHMKELVHHRDDTLREGVRTKKYSLAECINCHVSKDEKGAMPNFGEDKHFCSSCHNYAAVKVDCFQCHNDKPENDNYKHSLTDNPLKAHHKELALKGNKSLNQETLDVITSGGSK
jgi:hypothetical protein